MDHGTGFSWGDNCWWYWRRLSSLVDPVAVAAVTLCFAVELFIVCQLIICAQVDRDVLRRKVTGASSSRLRLIRMTFGGIDIVKKDAEPAW